MSGLRIFICSCPKVTRTVFSEIKAVPWAALPFLVPQYFTNTGVFPRRRCLILSRTLTAMCEPLPFLLRFCVFYLERLQWHLYKGLCLIYKRLKLICSYYLSLILMLENCLCFLLNGDVFQFPSPWDDSELAFQQEASALPLVLQGVTKAMLLSLLTCLPKIWLPSKAPSFPERKHHEVSD